MRSAAEENHCTVSFYPDIDAALPCLADCDILFAPSNAQSPALVKQAVNLKWFASYFAGVDPLLQPGVLRKNILLTNGSGAYGITIAEHMIMVSLMLLRRMPEYAAFVKNKEFRSDLMIGSLYGANVVICGTGDIGQSFAQRLLAFCPAKITGVNRTGRNVQGFDSVIPMERLDAVLPQADVLALALPGTKHTEGLISAQRIAAMKKTAILLNVGRGSCIDQDALIDALNEGQIAGAALDVFRTEPIPQDDPAWNTKKLLVTPHCSGKMTMQYTRDTLVNTFCENLKRFCEGSPLLHVVDTELGY
ncbi:MAG: D-2-hydroxyacid dehydrogenase [Faecousia sp.]